MSDEIILASNGNPNDIDNEMWEKIEHGYYNVNYNGHYKYCGDEESILVSAIISFLFVFPFAQHIESYALFLMPLLWLCILILLVIPVQILLTILSATYIGKQDFRKDKK